MKAICFDLNKTLIEENSWRNLNLELGVKPEEDDMLMDWGNRGIISDSVGQQIILNIYKESGKHSKSNILRILSNYHYKNGAQEIIQHFQNTGYEIFLVSGSIDIFVEKIAKELEISTWRANNKFIFDENEFLKDIITIDNDKITKLKQLEEICNERNINIKDVYCVGDGDNDIEIFKATGKGITFKGSKIKNHSYKIISELEDLRKIIP